MSNRRKYRRGFTLAEVLVVIGVIVLLVAILLPALQRARESAQMMRCSNNERNIWHAMTVYAADNDGILPVGPLITDVRPQSQQSNTVDPRIGWFFMRSPPPPQVPTPATPLLADFSAGGAICLTLGDPRSQTTPTSPVPDQSQCMRCPDATEGYSNFSYTLHPELNIHDGGARLSKIVDPARKIVIFEQDIPLSGQFGTLGPRTPLYSDSVIPGDPSIHHFATGVDNRPGQEKGAGRGNYCFADGHVESMFHNRYIPSGQQFGADEEFETFFNNPQHPENQHLFR